MRRLISGTILFVLLASLLLPACTLPVLASSTPKDCSEAWNANFQGIIQPDNPTVLQKIHSLCPTIDEEHFTENLLAVYRYAVSITYLNDSTLFGEEDYWQTSEETIIHGFGDCDCQAINLATLIEALYKQTYGAIPINLVWVVWGYVRDVGVDGSHCWVMVNEGLLGQATMNEIKSATISNSIIDVALGGVASVVDGVVGVAEEIWVPLDLSTLPSKNDRSLSIFYYGERYFELEATWNLPINQFYNNKYPYTEIYAIFNSQSYAKYPSFIQIEQTPVMGAEIRNVAFPSKVEVGETFTVNVTVQNYELGVLYADLVIILKANGSEVTRQNALVPKYLWQVKTFTFEFISNEPARTIDYSLELYWNNWGTLTLKDTKNFASEIVSNKISPSLTARSLSVSYQPQQDTYWCGPASLTMVMNYWGATITQAQVASEVYDNDTQLTYVSDMVSYPQSLGFDAVSNTGSLTSLKSFIDDGYPLIVLQKISISDDRGHFRVVVGYDDSNKWVVTHDPTVSANYNISYSDFSNLWEPGSTFSTLNWTLIIKPTNTLTPTPIPTATPTPTPTPTPSPSPSISPTPTASPSPSPTPTPSPTPSPSQILSSTPTPSPTPTAPPNQNPTATPTNQPTTNPTSNPTSNPTTTTPTQNPPTNPTTIPSPTLAVPELSSVFTILLLIIAGSMIVLTLKRKFR